MGNYLINAVTGQVSMTPQKSASRKYSDDEFLVLWSRDSYSRLLGSAESLRLGLADLQFELAACAKTKTVEVGELRGHQKHATY